MFDELTNRFDAIFKKVKGQGTLNEKNIADAMREVKRALLEADVNYRVVKGFVAQVKEKALGHQVLSSVTPGQQFVRVVHDELATLMGGEAQPERLHTNRLNVFALAGLQGSGKTTTCAKLALHFRKKGHRPFLVACDTHRAAAIDQLESLGKSLDIPVFSNREKKPATICREALKYGKNEDLSLAIIDTAGRLHIDETMMQELREIVDISNPDRIYFVADAMTGQEAVNIAFQFNEQIDFSASILTKMDADARGGAALSVLYTTGKPIQFIGTSEKPDGLELFHPDRMASRILGMGDVVSLVERAQEYIDGEKEKKLEKKIKRNAFTLQDFLDQLNQIKKMGSLEDLLGMIPGMGKKLDGMQIDNSALKKTEAIIQSMTPKEREKPAVIERNRKRRISAGSGTTVQDVNRLLKQFDQMKKMMKQMQKSSKKHRTNAAMQQMMQM